MEHTPGPWEVYEFENPNSTVFGIRDSEGKFLAGLNLDREQSQANGRLMAAAPEMLAALEDLRDIVEIVGECPSLTKARAAIAKAKGNPVRYSD